MALLAAHARGWTARRRKHLSAWWLAICALLTVGSPELAAQSMPPLEYQVKAVFLYHFAEFVEWPDSAFAAPQAPLVIGVLGDDPFGAYLDETVRKESMGSHPLIVRRYRQVEDVKACHILFISTSEADRMAQILHALRGRNILTVGESEHFARTGGIIEFFTERGKIRLRINAKAGNGVGLKISSQLLRLAEIEGG